MNGEDDDIHMSDLPIPPSTRSFIPPSRIDFVPSPSSRQHGAFSPSSRSVVTNGHQDLQTFPRPRIGDAMQNTSSSMLNGPPSTGPGPSHPSSTNVVESIKPSRERLDTYLAGLELEEGDVPQPFRSELATGYCYDVRMRYHCELEPPENRRDYHPEDPRRIFSIYRELCVSGLIDDGLLNRGSLVSRPLRRVDVREVDESEVTLVHDKKHWDIMKGTKGIELVIYIDTGVLNCYNRYCSAGADRAGSTT